MAGRSISKSLRFQVLHRDHFRCRYCGQGADEVVLHVDHRQAFSKGGPTNLPNLVTACRDCNLGKRDEEGLENPPVMSTTLEDLQIDLETTIGVLRTYDEMTGKPWLAFALILETYGFMNAFMHQWQGSDLMREERIAWDNQRQRARQLLESLWSDGGTLGAVDLASDLVAAMCATAEHLAPRHGVGAFKEDGRIRDKVKGFASWLDKAAISGVAKRKEHAPESV